MVEPQPGNIRKRMLCCSPDCAPVLFALDHRVDTTSQQPASVRMSAFGESQGDFRILAERHQLCLAAEAVGPTPDLATGRRHPKEHIAAIAELVGVIASLCSPDFGVAEHVTFSHRGQYTRKIGTRYPQTYPHATPASSEP